MTPGAADGSRDPSVHAGHSQSQEHGHGGRQGHGGGQGRGDGQADGPGFDRLRRRAGGPRRPVRLDAEGKRALFSPTDNRPAAGAVTVECSACRTRTSLAPLQAARVVLPGLHLPLPSRYTSLIRCPACGRRTWCRVRLRL